MRISNYSGEFALYEVMIRITAVGILSGLISVSLLPLLQRSEFVNTAVQFKDSLHMAKWLAPTKLKSDRIIIDSGFFVLQKKFSGSYQTVSMVKIPEEIPINANSWPSFSAFEFASGGLKVLENKDYRTKIVASPIGRFRQTAVERK